MSIPRLHVSTKQPPSLSRSSDFSSSTRMSCTHDLYCSPSQGDKLFPQQQYTFTWNSQLWGNQRSQGPNWGNNRGDTHGQKDDNKGGRGSHKVRDNQGNVNLLDIYLFQADQSNKVVQKFANAANDGQFGFTVDKVQILRECLTLGVVYDSVNIANTISWVEIRSGKCRRYAQRRFVVGSSFLCRWYAHC
jgi:hypothetical protein